MPITDVFKRESTVFCSRLRVRCRCKKFTFAISSSDELLVEINKQCTRAGHEY